MVDGNGRGEGAEDDGGEMGWGQGKDASEGKYPQG